MNITIGVLPNSWAHKRSHPWNLVFLWHIWWFSGAIGGIWWQLGTNWWHLNSYLEPTWSSSSSSSLSPSGVLRARLENISQVSNLLPASTSPHSPTLFFPLSLFLKPLSGNGHNALTKVHTYIWFKSNFYTTNGCLPPGSGFLFLKAIERPKTGLKSGQASKTLGSHSDGF